MRQPGAVVSAVRPESSTPLLFQGIFASAKTSFDLAAKQPHETYTTAPVGAPAEKAANALDLAGPGLKEVARMPRPAGIELASLASVNVRCIKRKIGILTTRIHILILHGRRTSDSLSVREHTPD